MSGIQVDKEALVAKAAQIAELDVVLDAQSGSKSAGKRAVVNALVTSSANTELVDKVIASIRQLSEAELFATFYAVTSALENELNDEAEEFVLAEVEKNQSAQTEKLSDEEIAKISEERKAHVQEFKALKNILEMFGVDVDDVPEPKIRRGSRGPRGPRTLSKFQYAINDVNLEDDANSLATVAKIAGNIKVKELKEIITGQGVDLKNPEAEWSAELPNGAGTLTATALPEFASDFEDDDEAETDAA